MKFYSESYFKTMESEDSFVHEVKFGVMFLKRKSKCMIFNLVAISLILLKNQDDGLYLSFAWIANNLESIFIGHMKVLIELFPLFICSIRTSLFIFSCMFMCLFIHRAFYNV